MEYNEALCNEKHATIQRDMDDRKNDINNIGNLMRESIDALHKKLNWFYVITIATLAGIVANFVKGL